MEFSGVDVIEGLELDESHPYLVFNGQESYPRLVDTNPARCEAYFGYEPGHRVKSQRGNGTVIGLMLKGTKIVLIVHVDAFKGASVITNPAGEVTKLSESKRLPLRKWPGHYCGFPKPKGKVLSERFILRQPTPLSEEEIFLMTRPLGIMAGDTSLVFVDDRPQTMKEYGVRSGQRYIDSAGDYGTILGVGSDSKGKQRMWIQEDGMAFATSFSGAMTVRLYEDIVSVVSISNSKKVKYEPKTPIPEVPLKCDFNFPQGAGKETRISSFDTDPIRCQIYFGLTPGTRVDGKATVIGMLMDEGKVHLYFHHDMSWGAGTYSSGTMLNVQETIVPLHGEVVTRAKGKFTYYERPLNPSYPIEATFPYLAGMKQPKVKRFDVDVKRCEYYFPGMRPGVRIRHDGISATCIGMGVDRMKSVELYFHMDPAAGAGSYFQGSELEVLDEPPRDIQPYVDVGTTKPFKVLRTWKYKTVPLRADMPLKPERQYLVGTRIAQMKALDDDPGRCMAYFNIRPGQRIGDGDSDTPDATCIGMKIEDGEVAMFFHVDGSPGAGIYTPDTELKVYDEYVTVNSNPSECKSDDLSEFDKLFQAFQASLKEKAKSKPPGKEEELQAVHKEVRKTSKSVIRVCKKSSESSNLFLVQSLPLLQDVKNALEEQEALIKVPYSGFFPFVRRTIIKGSPSFVYTFLNGCTLLHEALQKLPPMEVNVRFRCCLELAQALAEVHRLGGVHGDLSPKQCWLTRDRHILLMGFHSKKMLDALSDMAFPNDALAYRAPETFDGPFTPESDVFSLGVMMYELMTGSYSKAQETPSKVIGWLLSKRHLQDLKMPGVPDRIAAIIAEAWSDDPTHRPPAHEIVRRLSILAPTFVVSEGCPRQSSSFVSEVSDEFMGLAPFTFFSSVVPKVLPNCVRHVPVPSSLRAACEPLKDLDAVDDDTWSKIVADINKCQAQYPDVHRAVIRLWTGEYVYRIVNPICRYATNEAALNPVKPFLKLLLTALQSIHATNYFVGTADNFLYRGEIGTIPESESIFKQGSTYYTSAFTATNKTLTGVETIPGMKERSIRTVYMIEAGEGYQIQQYSQFLAEDEVLLPPCAKLRVIRVEEIRSEQPMTDYPLFGSVLKTLKDKGCPLLGLVLVHCRYLKDGYLQLD